MDFNILREQILANIEHYSIEETKIVVAKLLDFLVEISEKRSKLESENKALFEEMNDLRKNQKLDTSEDYKLKIDRIITKANEEAKKIMDSAKENAENIIFEANEKSKSILNESNIYEIEEIKTFIEKMEQVVQGIKQKDEEAKLYRKHILSIFRKAIFRFADTNYYIIRSDNKDFRELLEFFKIDEKLQKICDENIKNLNKDPQYQMIIDSIKDIPIEEDKTDFHDILKDDKVTIDNKAIELKDIEINETEEISNIESESIEEKTIQNKSKFLDVINQYKKDK